MSVLSVAENVERRAGVIISGFGFYNVWVKEAFDAAQQMDLGRWELAYIVQRLEDNPQVRNFPELSVHAAVLALARARIWEIDGRDPAGYLRDVDKFLCGANL